METQKKKRITWPARWQFLILVPFSLCYAVFIVLGNWQKSAEYSNLQNIGRILLWAVAAYAVLFVFCLLISRKNDLNIHLRDRFRADNSAADTPKMQWRLKGFIQWMTAQEKRPGRWYVFFGFFVICLLSYLPYYLMYYPTWFNNDAIWQLEQIFGWKARSNHHPYFHTLIMQLFVTIGYKLSGTYTGAVAFYTFWQMALVAFTFAFCLYVLYKRGTRLLWLILALAFYIVLPIHGMLSICMGKDAFFVSALVFFAWMSHTFDLEKERGIRQWALYFMTGLSVCLLRSNGILIFTGTVFVEIVCKWCCRKKGKDKAVPVRTLACAVAVLACYLLYQGPILKGLQVEKADTIEGLTMPTQHLLCAYMRGGNLTQDEISMMEQVVPLGKMEEYYNPYLFDVTKNLIREEGSQQVIAENKWEYFKLWLRVGLRNPMLYLEGEVRQTAGYWAYRVPHDLYLYGEYFMVDNPFGIVSERKLFTYDQSLAMGRYLKGFQDLYNKVWSLGLNTWVMMLCLVYLAWQRKRAMCCVPFIMLLVSLLLASPVYNEFRYAYGLFAAFPLLFGYTFGQAEKREEGDGHTEKGAALSE